MRLRYLSVNNIKIHTLINYNKIHKRKVTFFNQESKIRKLLRYKKITINLVSRIRKKIIPAIFNYIFMILKDGNSKYHLLKSEKKILNSEVLYNFNREKF